jgi:hypothetical protein
MRTSPAIRAFSSSWVFIAAVVTLSSIWWLKVWVVQKKASRIFLSVRTRR